MPTKIFYPSPTDFQSYLIDAKNEGFTVSPDADTSSAYPVTGTVSGKGVTLNYHYDASNPSHPFLILNGVSKPWLVSWDYIWSLIAEHLS